jgi:hypothetical protein
MRRMIVVVLLALAAVGLSAAPAQAERTCYSPGVAGFDTYEVCYFLPIELGS